MSTRQTKVDRPVRRTIPQEVFEKHREEERIFFEKYYQEVREERNRFEKYKSDLITDITLYFKATVVEVENIRNIWKIKVRETREKPVFRETQWTIDEIRYAETNRKVLKFLQTTSIFIREEPHKEVVGPDYLQKGATLCDTFWVFRDEIMDEIVKGIKCMNCNEYKYLEGATISVREALNNIRFTPDMTHILYEQIMT